MKNLTLIVTLSLGLFVLWAEALTIPAQQKIQPNLKVVEKPFEPEPTAEEKSKAEEKLIQAQQKILPKLKVDEKMLWPQLTARESGVIAPKAAEDKIIQAQQKNEHKLKLVEDFSGPKLNRAGRCFFFCFPNQG